MKTYKDMLLTEQMIHDSGYKVKNNIIEKVDVNIIAHFNNEVFFEIYCRNIVPYCNRSNTKSLGAIIKTIVKLFGIENEDGIRMSQIKDIPCRLVFENNNTDNFGCKAVGIGHFMNDRFILFDDLSTIGID